jgi:2-keto-3-deoxy-L-rhamnonate aldolase RhmA
VIRLGAVLSLPDVVLAETIAEAFDLAWIDLEHGALDARDVAPLAVALRAASCEAHVRIPNAESDALPPALDAGVAGIVLPQAEEPRAVEELARRLRYPPEGRRGYGPRRAGRHGTLPPRPALTVQIESPAGVRAARAIASYADTLVVGTADLAMTLSELTMPDAVAEVERAAREADTRFGVAGGGDPAALVALSAQPPDVLVCAVDIQLVARAADEAAAAAVRAGGVRVGD